MYTRHDQLILFLVNVKSGFAIFVYGDYGIKAKISLEIYAHINLRSLSEQSV